MLWIINKAGGLIYTAEHWKPDPSSGAPALSSNEYLILAGTLHSIHLITQQLSPVPNKRTAGLESLEADNFRMTVLMTATGVKFVLVSSPAQTAASSILQKVYEAYADVVMKSPFYTAEMPIRVEAFDRAVATLLQK
ncbi:hypothetical protein OC846_001634 [Tilletia horrida]|uniref:Trafficking protein particle complex subunit n=1 Tax=Tilletia horrida TaxID=155126 RepID=A0AAN6GSE7_9BASI|nr:hypothetical protein OC845_003026 [Tilletia horrida]KAK0555669.1 hypothetical protein OC846_001634 [Tilletia horrida]KAK0568571.1 hypothetical protein OC861_001819 [Tilletia horrida]